MTREDVHDDVAIVNGIRTHMKVTTQRVVMARRGATRGYKGRQGGTITAAH